jgi:hypothetical protein
LGFGFCINVNYEINQCRGSGMFIQDPESRLLQGSKRHLFPDSDPQQRT